MNGKIHIDANIARLLFYKYKSVIIPIVITIISWIIFFQYSIPQIQNFLSTSSQVQESEQTLAVMTQNYNTVVQMNDNDLNTLLSIASRALPTSKDFGGILTGISGVVAKTGVGLNDYSFSVGDITSNTVEPNGSATVQLALTINGSVDQVKRFLTVLSQQFPLSDVTSISLGGDSTAIPANFFYSPTVNTNFVDTSPLPVVSATQRKMLLDLAKNAGDVTLATSSAIPSQAPVSSSSAK